MRITCLIAAGLVGTALGVSAQIFTTESAFQAALASGYYLENFSSLTPFNSTGYSSLSFSGGTPTFSYTVTAPPNGVYVNQDQNGNNAVGNFNGADNLVITFTSPNVHAVGAEFYATDFFGNDLADTVTITYSDGTTGTIPSTTAGPPYGFFGYISSTAISSLTIEALADSSHYVNLANLYVGTSPVPEPATGLLLLTGMAGFACARRRK